MAASEKKIRKVLKSLTSHGAVQVLAHDKQVALQDLRGVLATPNVVGIGIARKRTEGKPIKTLALIFYVLAKVDKANLTAADYVPPALPKVLSGPQVIPTDVVELGEIRPQVNVVRNPVQPGNSIGHPTSSPGTFGAVVRDGSAFLALSNSHVLARGGLALADESILYPGAGSDGGTLPDDEVGKLLRFTVLQPGGQFVNSADAAVCSVSAAALAKLRADVRTLGITPTGLIKAHRDMIVEKVGRTSDLTEGVVVDADFHGILNYPGIGLVGFAQQVLCTRYTEDGDSGSLVLEKDTHKAVGLHVGAADGGSMFTPIREVLTAVGAQLVTSP